MNQKIVSMAHNSDKQIVTSGSNTTHDVSLNANVLAKELFWYIKLDKYRG
jgi:hypothetical protein